MSIKEPIGRYWMVHNAGRGMPHKMHPSREEAEAEARRLAKVHPGEVFYVLGIISALYTEIPEPWFVYHLPEERWNTPLITTKSPQ